MIACCDVNKPPFQLRRGHFTPTHSYRVYDAVSDGGLRGEAQDLERRVRVGRRRRHGLRPEVPARQVPLSKSLNARTKVRLGHFKNTTFYSYVEMQLSEMIFYSKHQL
jgi:hypothetical protein